MTALRLAIVLWCALQAAPAFAWGSHSFATYRALENMPEVADTPAVAAEPLDDFLRSEEKTIEALLASQEAWASANLDQYPPRPAALSFSADSARSDEARRRAFLMALRVAPDSKFALFQQPDPWAPAASGPALPASAVSTVTDAAATAGLHFVALKPAEMVSPLTVIASATDEPDFGLDVLLWQDSPSDWGRMYGLGNIPFGDPTQAMASQEPFHMSLQQESHLTYMALPALRHTYLLLRHYQFSTLAALAFRTGHPYWGWRFTGLALHYLQDLVQPFRASLTQGDNGLRLWSTSLLFTLGITGPRTEYMNQLERRVREFETRQSGLLQAQSSSKPDSPPLQALHGTESDRSYPDWNDHYLRDIVAPQSGQLCPALSAALQPEGPGFDTIVLELLANFGAHCRNAVRGILRAGHPM